MRDRRDFAAHNVDMHIIVTLTAAHTAAWMPLFRLAWPTARIEQRIPDWPPDPVAVQADYVVVIDPCRTVFDEQRHPRAVFTGSAGVRHMLRLASLPRNVPLVRVEDAGMALPMSHYVLAVALRFAQRFDLYARQQRNGIWEKHPARSTGEIAVGVLGLGVIGTAIAETLAAQGFSVRGFARARHTIDGIRCHAGIGEFATFLDGVDVLVNVLPDTTATTGILDRTALARLANGAHVINIGRGSAVVEQDLLDLLDRGKLSGATLDVFATEPLPPDHPFWRRPDIAVTPHIAGPTVPAATVAQIADKIARMSRGEAISGVVDVEREY
ncbi:MAG: glyoxylate/hydroxypyruvate reductase A [Betaproteobacteria bacterium]